MLKTLKPAGRYVIANPRLRDMFQTPLTNLFGSKKVIFQFASERADDLRYLLDLIDQGTIKPVIDKVFPLEQTEDAHRYVESGVKVGCVVIDVESKTVG